MILMAEILGVILALLGSYILSKRPQKILGALPWIFFIIADSLHAVVYLSNNQDGMVFNQMIGVILCTIGLIQYLLSTNNKEWSEKITKLMYYLFWMFISAGVVMLVNLLFQYTLNNMEWMLAFFAIAGTTLMASRHKNAKYVYFMWITCDSIFLYLCIINEQYAIALLRTVFICINCNGVKNWFMPNGLSLKEIFTSIKVDFKKA